MSDRSNHLAAVIENFIAKYKDWVALPGNELDLSMEFWVATDELMETFGMGDMPERFRDISELIQNTLRPQWEQHRIDAELNDYRILPGNGFWRGIDHLEAIRKRNRQAKKVRLEPVADLVAQKVTLNQIAKMYGWVDSDSVPETWRVQEEIQTPGTHTGEDFVPPVERERIAAEKAQIEIYNRNIERRNSKVQSAEPAPEGFASLVEQGISARQIATMKHISVSEVFRICEESKLPMPPMDYEPATSQKAPQEPGNIPEAESQLDAWNAGQIAQNSPADDDDDYGTTDTEEIDSGDPGMTWEQECCTLKIAGYKNGEIAKMLSRDGDEKTLPQVNGVLRKWKNKTADYGIPYEEPAGTK